MWVTPTHAPGKNNIEAGQQSTILQDAIEWKFHPELFHKIADKFGKPGIDVFASRINSPVKVYAWHPGSKAMAVNAFCLTWNSNYF